MTDTGKLLLQAVAEYQSLLEGWRTIKDDGDPELVEDVTVELHRAHAHMETAWLEHGAAAA
jgi:hypothetical protein